MLEDEAPLQSCTSRCARTLLSGCARQAGFCSSGWSSPLLCWNCPGWPESAIPNSNSASENCTVLQSFLFISPVLHKAGLSIALSINIETIVWLTPAMLGILLYQARRQTGTFSLKGIMSYRQKLPLRHYLILVPVVPMYLVVWRTKTFTPA